MTEPAPTDLIHLGDPDGDHCVVRVRGRFQPGVLTGHDILHADVLLPIGLVDAPLDLYLLPHDLDSWERELSALGPGRTAGIGGDRGLSLDVRVQGNGRLSIQVDDPDNLTAVLDIKPGTGWIAEHHQHLAQVRRTWPREVVETSPGAYEWSPPPPAVSITCLAGRTSLGAAAPS